MQFHFVLTLFIASVFNYHDISVNCFNYDTSAPVYKQANTNINIDLNENDIYFGYSIAQHIQKRDKQPYILVGAPKDSYKTFNMSGAIYKCPFNLDRTDDCEKVAVDFTSPASDESNRKYSDSTLLEQFKGRLFENQWFGVSLSSTGYGSFSACAHKYVHYYNFSKRDEHAAYGACYTFNNDFEQEYKHVPCLLYSHEIKIFYFNNYAYCQAGTSMLMTEGPNLGDTISDYGQDTFLSVGMPGALNFRGLIAVRNKKKNEFVYGNGTDICQFDIETDTPKKKGYCGNLWEKFSYLGMSHAIIPKYLNRDRESLIASGAPRDELTGVVRFFTITYEVQFGGPVTRRLSNLVLKGPSAGSYFGFSMASCDLNGDKMPDLIVGAPYFSRKHEPNSGAVYVYLNSKKGFTDKIVFNFTGTARSLFGHAISCLGDIDKDGFMDFAVGAPYEKNSEINPSDINPSTGAIYIFRGGAEASSFKLSQKILAQSVKLPLLHSSNQLYGFGYSLSGGLDMDSNTYPDLAVGVLNSNAILVLRTAPVARIKAYINNYDSIQDLDQKQCKYDQLNASCFSVDYCIELVDSNLISIPMLNYTLVAEPDTVYSRVYFSKTTANKFSSNVQFDASRKYCSNLDLVIKKDTYDFLTPIKFMLSYSFVANRNNVSRESLNEINKHPIVHEDNNKFEFEANFKKDCGLDKKCITDLKLEAKFLNLTIGDDNITLISFKESDSVSLLIKVDNSAFNSEPAYATQITVVFDKRLDFIKKDDISMNSFSCAINYKNETETTSLLQCKIISDSGGIPFSSNYSMEFILTFSSTRLYRYGNITSRPDLKFKLQVSTLSTDIDLNNNHVFLLARLKVRANLFLYGTKTPEQLFYGDGSVVKGESAMKNLEEIGPIIEHTYKINNAGPFSVNYFQLIVDWPRETKLEEDQDHLNQFYQGKHLLYLVEKPTKIPNNHPINVICSSYEVDPLKLSENKVNVKKKRSIENDVEKIPISEQPSSRTAIIDCFLGNAYCQKITCNFYGNLNKGETISLKFTARVWNATLVEDFGQYEKVLIRSFGRLILSNDILDDKPSDNENSVATLAYSNVRLKSEKVLSMWVYILSVLVGLILLLLCTIGFWMIGFFERKKFGDEKYLEENDKLKKTPY